MKKIAGIFILALMLSLSGHSAGASDSTRKNIITCNPFGMAVTNVNLNRERRINQNLSIKPGLNDILSLSYGSDDNKYITGQGLILEARTGLEAVKFTQYTHDSPLKGSVFPRSGYLGLKDDP